MATYCNRFNLGIGPQVVRLVCIDVKADTTESQVADLAFARSDMEELVSLWNQLTSKPDEKVN